MLARLSFILVCTLFPTIAWTASGQQAFDDYFQALPAFWKQVYPQGGETLYCGREFGRKKDRSINIEHVYPMSWVMKALGCGDRRNCRRTSRRFNQIESDMHNFYPSRKDINKTRGSHPFGMIKGEPRNYGKCDFEFDPRRRSVEPRYASRGNIARSMFHMKETYGLKIYRKQGQMLQRWSKDDPPDLEERRRNDRIEQVQGTRNTFIDDPKRAAKLRF